MSPTIQSASKAETLSEEGLHFAGQPQEHPIGLSAGRLIINADDWGRDLETTDRTWDCIRKHAVSAVSAMVFMEDSERAAQIARGAGVDAGLHLNFTAALTGKNCSVEVSERQKTVGGYLSRHALARVFYHPGLRQSFQYVVSAQLDEYRRLYGEDPKRIDGHHHLHLSANVLSDNLLPAGTLVRRNFSFLSGEKSWTNRLYRRIIDRKIARRHDRVDFLFPLMPLAPAERLQHIFAIARRSVVEIETHPVNPDEHAFLTSGKILEVLQDLPISPNFSAAVAEARRIH